MPKDFIGRLGHALIGALFGAVLGALLWFLYDAGFSRRIHAPEIHLGLTAWMQYCGSAFAALGFLLKDRAGDLLGGGAGEVLRDEGRRLPWWLLLIVIGAVLAWVML